MQTFEFLGGKYQQGEQIVPGVVQTFRSYEVPSGRPVFIHRIRTDNPATPDIAKLLSASLIRSSAVRRMIVDVYETGLYRFIVTEAAGECVPLRDWLEREVGDAVEQAAEPAVAPADESLENTDKPAEPSDADFARLFREAQLERSKRTNLLATNPLPVPLVESVAAPVLPAAEQPERELPAAYQIPQLFTPVLPPEPARKSTLLVVLVVLGVVVVALVMFVVLFQKK